MKDLFRVAAAALVVTSSFAAQSVNAAVDSYYTQPDPNATSAAARFGYVPARDRATSLIRGDYLNVIHDAHPAMLGLARKVGTAGAGSWRACPQGGKVKASYTQDADNAFNRHWTMQFAGCKFEDRVLTGGVEVDALEFSATASHVATVFKNLSVKGPGGQVELTGLNGFDVRGSLYLPVRNDCSSYPYALFAQDNSGVTSVTIKQGGVVTTLENTNYRELSRAAQPLSSYDGGPPCKIGAAFSFEGAIERIATASQGSIGSSVSVEYNSRRNKYIDDYNDTVGGHLSITYGDGSGYFVDTPNPRGVSTVYARENGSAVSFTDDQYRYRPRIR